MLQVLPVVRARLGDLAVTAFEFEQRCTQVDIALNLYENPDGSYLGRFQFSTELFTTPTVERMSRNFLHLFKTKSSATLRGKSSKSRSSRMRNGGRFSRNGINGIDYPSDLTVQALFERQARNTPSSIAVECGAEQLTYQELNDQADELARRLQRFGRHSRRAGRRVYRALGGHDRGGARHLEIRGGLRAARSRVSRRPHRR